MANLPEDAPTVLVVEDERTLADLYASWLSDSYVVRVAYSGNQAFKKLDETVDVLLLDRRMPDVSGDDVLEVVNQQNLTCRVAMVTAVTPDFDIIEMGFDAYLVKPVDNKELRDVVERMLRRTSYDETVTELFQLATKRALLCKEKRNADLRSSQEFADLETRLIEVRNSIESTFDEFDIADFEAVMRQLSVEGDSKTDPEIDGHEDNLRRSK